MSGKAIRETLGFLAVIASMVFVGLQIQQSNVQARAAAFQEIGIATSEWHYQFDDRMNRLYREGSDPSRFVEWSRADWEAMLRREVSGMRLAETVLLQVEQGLLLEDAIGTLGYEAYSQYLSWPLGPCMWVYLRTHVGPSLISLVESMPVEEQAPLPS